MNPSKRRFALACLLASLACAPAQPGASDLRESGDIGWLPADAGQADAAGVDSASSDSREAESGATDLGSNSVDGGTPDAATTDSHTGGDSAVVVDAGLADSAAVDATSTTAQPGFAQSPLPGDASRAWRYVRTHTPFISGLVVQMGEVTPAVIDGYFDEFGATALHTWEDGLGAPVNSWRQQGDIPYVSWVRHDGVSVSNNQILGGMPASVPGRIGIQVGDEPRTQAEFDGFLVGVQAVQQHDPDALIILNWSYNAEGLLPGFFASAAEDWGVDIFSYDAYSTSRNVYERYHQFASACRQHAMPCWRYLDSYWDDSHDDDLTAIDMRWDAMTGLVYGYSGHSWFIYQIKASQNGLHSNLFDGNDSWSAQPTEKYAWAAAINQELQVLGESFNQLTPVDARFGFHWPSVPAWGVGLALPDNTPVWEPGAGGDPYLVELGGAEGEADMDLPIGFFVDGWGSRYLAVANGRHPGGSWPVDNGDPGTVRLVFDFGGAPAGFDREIVRALDAASVQVIDLPLQDLGGDRRALEQELEAGQLLLFKYANGQPFARRLP